MKSIKFFIALIALALVFSACQKEEISNNKSIADNSVYKSSETNSIVWNGELDKAAAVEIQYVPSQRTNASGPKISSNAHSADFPGIYFIWDSKQKDNGYLKVASWVFDRYESFVLTSKESNKYFDFSIVLLAGQQMTSDDCYVFYIPKVYNNKNINMVFLSEFVEKVEVFQES